MFALIMALAAALPLTEVVRTRAKEVGTKLTNKTSFIIANAALKAEYRLGVPVAVTLALIEVESSYRVDALSRAGCRGLVQLAPATASWTARLAGIKRWRIDNPSDNVNIGTSYLTYLLTRYGSLDKALTAYNRGMGNFERGGRRPNAYARRVINTATNVTIAMAN